MTAVASPFALRTSPTEGNPAGVPVFGPDIGAAYGTALAAFAGQDTGLPTFLNPQLSALLLAVSMDTDHTTVAAAVAEISGMVSAALVPTSPAKRSSVPKSCRR